MQNIVQSYNNLAQINKKRYPKAIICTIFTLL